MAKVAKSGLENMRSLLQSRVAEINTAASTKSPLYISQEFQDFGYRLALRLNDLKHKSLYIKLCKQVPRALLEDAAAFTSTYPRVKSQGRVFMWKLRELIAEYNQTHDPKINLGRTGAPAKRKKEPKAKVETNLSLPLEGI